MNTGFMKSKSVLVGSQRFLGSLGRWYNDQNIFIILIIILIIIILIIIIVF